MIWSFDFTQPLPLEVEDEDGSIINLNPELLVNNVEFEPLLDAEPNRNLNLVGHMVQNLKL